LNDFQCFLNLHDIILSRFKRINMTHLIFIFSFSKHLSSVELVYLQKSFVDYILECTLGVNLMEGSQTSEPAKNLFLNLKQRSLIIIGKLIRTKPLETEVTVVTHKLRVSVLNCYFHSYSFLFISVSTRSYSFYILLMIYHLVYSQKCSIVYSSSSFSS